MWLHFSEMEMLSVIALSEIGWNGEEKKKK